MQVKEDLAHMRRVDNEYNYPKYWYIALQLAQENKYYIYFFRNTIFGQVEILYCEGKSSSGWWEG